MRRGSPARVAAYPAFAALGALSPAAATAQRAADSAAALPERGVCWRGRPAPRCDMFWVTEIGYYARAAGTSHHARVDGSDYRIEQRELGSHLAFEVGPMVNRGARAAIGGTLLVGFEGGGSRVGVRGRYRRWLDAGGTSVEGSLGVLRAPIARREPFGRVTGTGVTAEAGFNLRDHMAVTARTDVVRGGGRTGAALYGGVKLGGLEAAIATGVLALGATVLAIAFVGVD